MPFYIEDDDNIYDFNQPIGFIDIKVKNEVDKQENYFNVKRYKINIDY